MSNIYFEYKENRKNGINNFQGLFWAFNNEQFKEGIQKVGANKNNKVINIGAGGYVLKNKLSELQKVIKDQKTGLKTKLKNKKFAYDAFEYELANTEYNITHNENDVLEMLGISLQWIEKYNLADVWQNAKKYIIENSKNSNW